MKLPVTVAVLSLLFATAAGCDGGEKKSIADQIGPATKSVGDIKAAPAVSEEELAKRRKEAGFRSKEEVDAELAAENAKMFEKGDREYVKARLKEYRKLTADTRKLVDDIEKEAGKWAAAKDPAKAFAKNGEALSKRAKELQKTLDSAAMSDHGQKGGNTQATLNKAFRPLEELGGALGPEVSKEPAFATTLKTIRDGLTEAEAALTDIEKDESLVASKFAGKDGEAAPAEDGAKAEKEAPKKDK